MKLPQDQTCWVCSAPLCLDLEAGRRGPGPQQQGGSGSARTLGRRWASGLQPSAGGRGQVELEAAVAGVGVPYTFLVDLGASVPQVAEA